MVLRWKDLDKLIPIQVLEDLFWQRQQGKYVGTEILPMRRAPNKTFTYRFWGEVGYQSTKQSEYGGTPMRSIVYEPKRAECEHYRDGFSISKVDLLRVEAVGLRDIVKDHVNQVSLALGLAKESAIFAALQDTTTLQTDGQFGMADAVSATAHQWDTQDATTNVYGQYILDDISDAITNIKERTGNQKSPDIMIVSPRVENAIEKSGMLREWQLAGNYGQAFFGKHDVKVKELKGLKVIVAPALQREDGSGNYADSGDLYTLLKDTVIVCSTEDLGYTFHEHEGVKIEQWDEGNTLSRNWAFWESYVAVVVRPNQIALITDVLSRTDTAIT